MTSPHAAGPKVEAPPNGGASHFGEEIWEKLEHFASMIEREGEKRGLVGPRELERLWTRHILNSTAILDFIPKKIHLVDVGSGAGFPGLIAAITRPDLRVTLIDSMERRCVWLNDAIKELSLENVKVRHGRSENFVGHLQGGVVTARAVASLKKLLPWTMPLLHGGGQLVTLKGARVDQEIHEADAALRAFRAQWVDVHEVVPFGTQEPTMVLVVQKQ